jgi:hypothetical protein
MSAMTPPTSPIPSTPADHLPGTLRERYQLVQDSIARAAAKSGRKASDVLLVAVTKHAAPEQIREMIDLGHRDFGENRVQVLMQHAALAEEYQARLRIAPSARRQHNTRGEALLFPEPQAPAADDVPVRWHMIGHLQRNKARKAMEYVRLVHSVDSLRLAEELQTIGLRRDQIIEVLLQVNIAGEEQKTGIPGPAVLPLCEQIDTMVHVRVRGLMTMAPYSDKPEDSRGVFARCRELFDDVQQAGVGEGRFNILSMGMSGDYQVAIEEGANLVRVGTSLFGAGPAAGDELDDEPREAPEA